jgi:DNA-binding cell septation regulator SpoVG
MTKREKIAKINEIVFFPIKPTPKGVVCFVSFNYSNLFRIMDCAIVTKPQGGYRIVYPIRTLPNGKVINSVYPLSETVAKPIEDFILSEFVKEKVINE